MKSLAIVAFLAIQLGVPASYYWRDEPLDERFAWRMFSPIRVASCRLTVTEGPDRRPARMGKDVHVVWTRLLRRGRPAVAKAFAKRRCAALQAAGEAGALYIGLSCTLPDGRELQTFDPTVNRCETAW